MKYLYAVAVLVLLMTSGALAYDEVRTLGIAVEENAYLEVNCGAGFLDIEGVEGLQAIEVVAKVQIDNLTDAKKAERYLEKALELKLHKDKGRYILTSYLNQSGAFFSWLAGAQISGRVNLFVKVPVQITLKVDDGSGDIQIRNISGKVSVEDGSGDTAIIGITGQVQLEDGSGNLVIQNVAGEVKIEDGSGTILVGAIKGSVTIHDGSGSITVNGVEKDVTILDAGTGSVELKNIQGKITQQ